MQKSAEGVLKALMMAIRQNRIYLFLVPTRSNLLEKSIGITLTFTGVVVITESLFGYNASMMNYQAHDSEAVLAASAVQREAVILASQFTSTKNIIGFKAGGNWRLMRAIKPKAPRRETTSWPD